MSAVFGLVAAALALIATRRDGPWWHATCLAVGCYLGWTTATRGLLRAAIVVAVALTLAAAAGAWREYKAHRLARHRAARRAGFDG